MQQPKTVHVYSSKEFRLPEVPLMLTDSVEISKYIALHYWDNYDFKTSSETKQKGSLEEIFSNFIGFLQNVPLNVAASGIKTMMQKAQADSLVFSRFMSMCERHLYDATSPNRNDELYIPALEVIIASNLITPTYKIRPQFQLKMALKNRVGTKASNLFFELANGHHESLYQIESRFTILLFYNPGCHTCQETLSKMKESALVSRLIAEKKLHIAAIYTDSDKKEWLDYNRNIPATWTNGWDQSQKIKSDLMYDLKASPTLYLLDEHKKVILKDAQIEYIINYLEQLP